MKHYKITVKGFPPFTIIAESAGAARYLAFRQYREGWTQCTFRDFLGLVRVRRARHAL